MSDIQVQPAGLFSFLQLKGSPGPRVFAEQVLPTLDLSAFYRAGRLQTLDNSVTLVSTVGTGSTLVVPPGENWLVAGVMGALSTPSAVGTIMAARVAVAPPGGFSFDLAQVPVLGTGFTSVAATDQVNNGFWFPTPQIFTPGTSFITALTRPCGGVNTLTTTVRVAFVALGV